MLTIYNRNSPTPVCKKNPYKLITITRFHVTIVLILVLKIQSTYTNFQLSFPPPKLRGCIGQEDGSNSDSDRVRKRDGKLRDMDQFLSVLMRLRLGLFVMDIAEKFCISQSLFLPKTSHLGCFYCTMSLTL